jgi:hypothetical protein
MNRPANSCKKAFFYIEEGDKMYCKFCGQKIKDGVNFCPHCGKPTSNKISNGGEQKRNKKKGSGSRRFIPIIVLELILVLIISGVIFRIYKERSENHKFIAYYEPVDEEKIRYEQGERFVEAHLLLTAREDADFEEIEALVQEANELRGGEWVQRWRTGAKAANRRNCVLVKKPE